MVDFWFWFQLWTYLAAGSISVLMTLFSKVLHSVTLIAQMAVVAGLALQAVLSVVLVAVGQRAQTSTLEFFGYLIVALMVSVGAIIWGLLDRKNRWSNAVLALSAFTVAVMVIRMQQLWTGVSPV
jgi:uncharacterized membrane protein